MAADGQHPDASALIADALDGIGQGVLIVDADGRMVRGNRRFLELYGVGEELIRPGLPFDQHLRMMADRGLITGVDPEKQIAARLASLKARRDFEGDRRLPNGTVISLTGHALANGGYAFTFSDVTERTRHAETLAAEVDKRTEELKKDRSVLRATLDNMAQGIIVVDADFDVKAFNARFLELFDVEASAVENPQGFRRLVRTMAARRDYGPDVTEETALARYATASRFAEGRIFEFHRPNGRVIEVSSSPLPDGGFVSTYTDITRRSKAEAAMRQRDAIVSALHTAASAILASNDWTGPVETMLATIGEVTGVSRVFFAHDYRAENGLYKQQELFQWRRPGVSSFWDNPKLRTMPVKDDAFQDWRERRRAGETVQAIVSHLGDEKRRWLQLQDMKALVRVPVFVSGQMWGTIGFDDCFEERVWSEADIEALKAAAALIGVAVARVESIETLRGRETELARKSAVLSATLDNTVQAISMFDADMRLVAHNKRYVDMIGLPAEFLATEPTLRELLVKQIENGDVMPPEGMRMPEDKEAITDYWYTRAPPPDRAYAYERARADGSVVEVFSNPLPDGGFIRVITDITRQKKGEEVLRKALADTEAAEAKVRDILESLPVGVLVLDEDRGIEMWNEAYVKYTGVSAANLDAHRSLDDNSRFIYNSYPHMQTMPVEEFIEARRKRMFVEGFSVREVTFEDPRYDIQYIIAPLKSGGAVNVIVDITPQKDAQRDALRARAQAEATEAQFRAILNHLPIGILVVDENQRLNYWNRTYCEVTDTEDSFYQTNPDIRAICAYVHERFPGLRRVPLDAFTKAWIDRFFGSDFAPREVEFESPRVNTLQFVAALPDGGRMLVVVDITKQKDSERVALKARQEAEHASQAKSQFLAAMSHEIRTPMNGVLGMLELLKGTRLDAEQSEMVSVVRESANSLLKIIDDILDFSKIEAGKIEMEQVELSPLQVVEGVAETLAAEARKKEIAVVTFVDPAVPDPLAGDAVRLRQILFNLVGNAIKFTQAGEVSISTRIAEETSETVTLRFEVRDTGIGLDDDQKARLFQPFMQADSSTTRRFGGTGLGLSISKRLVELMDGTINVDSTPGQGSTFSFTAKLARRPDRRIETRKPLQGQRLLVVDDSAMVRDLVTRYIVEAGAETATAGTGRAGLDELARAAAAGKPYQAAILDMRLPDGDGWALGRMIRETPALAATRLVLLTAFDEPDHRRKALGQGFSAYLTKPIRRSLLLSALVPAVDKESQAKSEETAAPPSDALILVAEDNPTNRAVIAKQLKKLGYRYEIFADGRAAMDAFERGRHALVLTDCHMPVMDGFALTMALRDQERSGIPRIPIVALTANALQGEAEKCLAAGMDDYIAKPASLAQLSSVLRRWTAGVASSEPIEAAATRDLPIFDRTILDELFEDSTEERRNLLVLFAQSVEQSLGALPAALDRDREEARGLAHSIKGAARSAGAARVGAAAEALEAALKAGDDTLVPFANLMGAFEEAKKEMRKS